MPHKLARRDVHHLPPATGQHQRVRHPKGLYTRLSEQTV